MYVHQRVKQFGTWGAAAGSRPAQLVLAFAPREALEQPATWSELATEHPGARIVGCSTAGEIAGTRVQDDTIVATALALDHGRFEIATIHCHEAPDSAQLGSLLAARLPHDGLVHVLVLSDGIQVDGSALVKGMARVLPAGVAVTGGLAGDGERFARTMVSVDGPAASEQVVLIGLYSPRLRVGYGSLGGWAPFGPERRVTRSEGNVLYELDGKPALDLYKLYLGEHAANLPGSALQFPLTIRSDDPDDIPVVRTIVGVDEAARTMTFAGSLPRGYRVRLMHASFERLVEGASDAARSSVTTMRDGSAQLAILISCVGRRIVLKQRIEEEVEAVEHVVGSQAVMTGFYSYGEIAPFVASSRCELHNQTMTITTLSEA